MEDTRTREGEGRGERRAVGPVGGGVRGMLTGNMRGLDGQFVLMLCCATTRRRGKLAHREGVRYHNHLGAVLNPSTRQMNPHPTPSTQHATHTIRAE